MNNSKAILKLKIVLIGVGFFILNNTNLIGQIPMIENKIVITNEAKVNSENLEYSPAFYKDGIAFISTSVKGIGFRIKDKNIDTYLMNIYQAQRDENGYLKEPIPFAKELVEKVHEGPVTFSSTGSKVFFTRNEKKEKAENGWRKLQIFEAELIGSEWTNIKELEFNDNEYNYMHPTVSVDGNTLYFASDIPGGEGGMDLYKSEKSSDGWGTPINLGVPTNTAGDEVFPFIHADGTLYFSSDNHSTIGGLDVFYTNLEGDDNPINLGEPFNTEQDDFGFIIDADNKNGYFSSSRPKGLGGDDLYSFNLLGDMNDRKEKKKKKAPIAIMNEDGLPLDNVQISYANSDELTVSNGVTLKPNPMGGFVLSGNTESLGKTTYTNADGEAFIEVGDGNYIVTVTQPGYMPQQILITPDTDLSKLNIQMKEMVDCVALTGRVVLTTTKPVAGAIVKAINIKTGEILDGYSGTGGEYNFCLPCHASYTVFATKGGENTAPRVISTQNIDCDNNSGLIVNLSLSGVGTAPIAGTIIQLQNVYFNFADSALRPDARADLDLVIKMLQAYPEMKVELASHTDSRGSKKYNSELSHQRSESVFFYIINQGIDRDRLTPKGYGEQDLRNRCGDFVKCRESEHQVNRRTEIRILGTDQKRMTSFVPNNEPDGLFFIAEEKAKNIDKPFVNQSPDKTFLNTSPQDIEAAINVNLSQSVVAQTSDFMVVAGTFESFGNAQERVDRLKKLGYSKTSIIQFDGSTLQLVVVDKINSEFDAVVLSQKIMRETRIEAYVKSY